MKICNLRFYCEPTRVNTRGSLYRYAACVTVFALLAGANADTVHAQQPGGAAASKAVRVEVAKPVRRPMKREVCSPATLMADEVVDIYAKASGYVSKIDVNIGSQVKEGDVLVELSVPEMADELRQVQAVHKAKLSRVQALQAKVAQAQQHVNIAKARVRRYEAEGELETANLKRKEELFAGKAIPQQAVDEARSANAIAVAQLQIAHADVSGAASELQAVQADVAVAESQALVAQANTNKIRTLMTYASIRAPFDGVITERNVDHGAFVRSAQEGMTTSLLQIAKIDRMRVVVEISETDVPFVRVGASVTIDVKALDQGPIQATMTRIASSIKPSTRTMRAEIDIDNSAGNLTPGMYAAATIALESKTQAMMIPSKALRMDNKQTIVMVAANGQAQSMPIDVGYDDGIWAEVLSGLSGDEAVITATSGSVTSGAAIIAFASDS